MRRLHARRGGSTQPRDGDVRAHWQRLEVRREADRRHGGERRRPRGGWRQGSCADVGTRYRACIRPPVSELRSIGMFEYRSGAIALTSAGSAVRCEPPRLDTRGAQWVAARSIQCSPRSRPWRHRRILPDELAQRLGWDASGSDLRMDYPSSPPWRS
jgi:hypothetical protein